MMLQDFERKFELEIIGLMIKIIEILMWSI